MWSTADFVTYSNEAKTEMLGVPADVIASDGAVSEPVARAMAEGALERSLADVTVAVTGVAGPGGGSVEKPVGLVHFGLAAGGKTTTALHKIFDGDRRAIRLATVAEALSVADRKPIAELGRRWCRQGDARVHKARGRETRKPKPCA